jgi:hypothetical protein
LREDCSPDHHRHCDRDDQFVRAHQDLRVRKLPPERGRDSVVVMTATAITGRRQNNTGRRRTSRCTRGRWRRSVR